MVGRINKTFPSAVFFHSCYNAFQKAEQKTHGTIDKFFNIAGYTIQLRFAGPILIPLITPALNHLAIKPKLSTDLTICLWESVTTGIRTPFIPSLSNMLVKQGEIYNPNNKFPKIYNGIYPESQSIFTLDIEKNLAIFCVRDINKLTLSEKAAPLIHILQRWMSNANIRQFLHAGAIGTNKGCVLLAGQGGSGKSTTALICFNAGCSYISDDYCIISTFQKNTKYRAYSIYNSAKLDINCFYKPAELTPFIVDEIKSLYFLHEHIPEKIVSSMPIKAIVCPVVTNNPETKICLSTRAKALKSLAPSSLFQLAGSNNRNFQNIVNLIKAIPCYNLEVGTNIKEIPQVIKNLLNGEI